MRLPLAVDVRDEASVKAAIEATAAKFGGIDIVVNNASAISLTPVAATDMKRFDLMMGINARGTFMVSKYALAASRQGRQPAHSDAVAAARHAGKMVRAAHRLLDGEVRHEPGGAGLAGEQRGKIAVNALWPRTTIATAAIKNLLGGDAIMRMSRKPDILAEAAYRIFHKPKSFTGNFLIDDTFLAGEGITDFDQYRADPSQPLAGGFFRARQRPAAARRKSAGKGLARDDRGALKPINVHFAPHASGLPRTFDARWSSRTAGPPARHRRDAGG